MNSAHLSSEHRTRVLQNVLFISEFEALAESCERAGIPLVGLKGITFFGRIYDSSERDLTDIDVLVPPQHLSALREVLSEMGFVERVEEKWSENNFKFVFTRFHLGLEIVLEVHTQLTSSTTYSDWQNIPYKNYYLLEPADELLYLAHHYAGQHTLLKSKWLHDLYLLSVEQPQLWNAQLWQKAQKLQVLKSLDFTAQALKVAYDFDVERPPEYGSYLARAVLNLEFLEDPSAHFWRYLAAKHLVKESLWQALTYNVQWVYFAIKQRLNGKR